MSSINNLEVNRRMVTWKDTVTTKTLKSKSECLKGLKSEVPHQMGAKSPLEKILSSGDVFNRKSRIPTKYCPPKPVSPPLLECASLETVNNCHDSLDLQNSLRDESDEPNTAKVVCLFQSEINLDLTRDNSLNTLTDLHESIQTITTLDLKSSTFSLKKSHSDLNVVYKGEFLYESESQDFRKTCQDIRSVTSTPALHLTYPTVIKPPQSEWNFKITKPIDWTSVKTKERLEILRIAAERFIEEARQPQPAPTYLEEDYSVPKKKRRVQSSDSSSSETTKASDGSSKRTEASLGRVMDLSMTPEITPRTVGLIEKVLRGRQLRKQHSNVMLAVTLSECERLLEIDSKSVAKVERMIDKSKQVTFPPVIVTNMKKMNRKVQVGTPEKICLPKIITRPEILAQNNLQRYYVG